jgi:predicted DCC family thiol-disulfide oxidoreductase YuxK
LPLPPLLAAKLAVVCLVLRLTWRDLPNPFLPFLPVFDYFRHTPLFGWGLKVAVLLGSAAVLFNYRVRVACLVIGSAFLVGILASRPYFENNIMYLGCLLFLLGLYEPRTGPWLIRAQIVLVFFAAALNKLLDPSWRSGQFFDYWASVYVNKSFYFQLSSWLPEILLPRVMSWLTIVIEFAISLGLLFRRSRMWAIWLGLLLAVGQNFLTERTFGVFFYVMPISYLAFVDWPRSRMIVLYDGDCGFCTRMRRLWEPFDLEGLFAWKPFQKAEELRGISEDALRKRLYVVTENRKYSGFAAFKIMALYNPLTYFALLLPLLLPQGVFFHHRSWLVVSFLLLFSPIFAPVGETLYAWIARNRHHILNGQRCSVNTPNNFSQRE